MFKIEYFTFYILILNLLAAGFMAYDKWAAIKKRWRVPEASLFLLAALGASPTVFFLITYLRHKSNKSSFRWKLNVILAGQIALGALAAVLI